MGLQDSERLIQDSDIRKLAIELRKRRAESSSEIDPALTVDSTARMAGWFTPVNLKRGHEPEYLILEERKNLRDHQPRSHDELFGKLRDHDVSIDRYFFQTDPRNCSDAKSRTFAINELSALHSAHQLWLILEPERCIDPLSGLPERWFAEIGKWKERVLLSLSVPPASLETNSARPNRRGIQSLVFAPEDQSPASTPYPSLLRQSTEKWLERAVPSEAAQLRLIAQLRLYLGPRRFMCLQACAVYPAIIWNVTRALVSKLLDRDEVEDALDSLITLPWFRYGTMPDWLRVRLVNNLGERENEVRKALKAYLEAGSEQGLARDGIDIAPAGREFLRRYGQLDDYIYLSFVSRHRLAKLSVQSPSRWRRLLRYSLVFRAATAIVLTAVAIVGLQTTVSRLNRLLVKKSQSKISIPVRPSEPFVASMLDVASVLNGPQNGSSRELLQRYSDVASDLLNVDNPLRSLLQNRRITPQVAAELPDVQLSSTTHPEAGMIWFRGEDAGLVIESGIASKREPWSQNSGDLFFMRLANLHLVSRSPGRALEVASAVSHGEIKKQSSSQGTNDTDISKGNTGTLTSREAAPVNNPITCSSGPFHEGTVFDWSFRFSPSSLRIDRSDGGCWGNFELSGTQWAGELDCNNGAANKKVSLNPNSSCTKIVSSLEWLTFDAGTTENAKLTANAPAQVRQALNSAAGVAPEPVKANSNSVAGTGILSPDRKSIASYDVSESMLTIKDASSGRFIRSMSVAPAPRSMAWSPTGTQIAVGKVDGTIGIVSISTGQVTEMIEGAGGPLSLLAWSPDGQRLAAALETGLILIYDVERREMTVKIFDDDKAVRDLTWSPDSRRITAGGFSGPRTWDAGSGTLLPQAK
jgi:WD40 repeat protein